MSLESVSAIGEIVGLAIIVISLIFISVQTRQANDHATANSEIAYVSGVDKIFHGWASDEQTFDIIRRGFSDFGQLKPYEMAVFQAKVGALVNHMYLGKNLYERKLLSKEIADEVEKVTIAVLSTNGGLEYWEHDSKAMPGGDDLLELVKQAKGKNPNWAELIPWWDLSKS